MESRAAYLSKLGCQAQEDIQFLQRLKRSLQIPCPLNRENKGQMALEMGQQLGSVSADL